MSATVLPPLVINVDCRRPSCVLDVHLAFSPLGLLFALRVAQEMNVWLVRTLWEILDNSQFYLNNPRMLLGNMRQDARIQSGISGEEHDALIGVLNQWQAARVETDLAGLSMYWAGDATQESLLPKDCDTDMVFRFETLASELDTRDEVVTSLGFDVQHAQDFARDAVALAGALIRYRPVIFTRLTKDRNGAGGEPLLCRFLRRCNISCHELDDDERQPVVKSLWRPLFNRSGVAELCWAGLQPAVVHLVAPGALIMQAERHWDQEDSKDKCWWRGAAAYWYPIHEA